MLHSKITTGESIFSVMSRFSRECRAINLGQGFPDFGMNNELIDLVSEAMQEGHNQYTPSTGAEVLRKAIAQKVYELYNLTIDPDTEICITPGGTYAIYTALTTVLNRGDEVIIFEPAYDSYIPNVEINGAVPVTIPLSSPDFRINWTAVEKAITSRTKMIIINQPHNPTGMMLSGDDMQNLERIVIQNKLYLLCDEVYEHLVYDRKRFESVLRYPELLKRTFATYSFGKVYHCTGWKTGYCIAPVQLMNEFVRIHQFNAFSCFGPVQFALAKFLEKKEYYLNLGKFLQPKRDLLQRQLAAAGFIPIPSYGTFFQLFDYSALSDLNEISFAKKITREAGVSAIPVSAFYRDKREQHLLRFCFAKKDSTIEEAGKRMNKYFG